ncbi:MAG: DUF5710 domain-containing protein [Burkholderiales bacterium]
MEFIRTNKAVEEKQQDGTPESQFPEKLCPFCGFPTKYLPYQESTRGKGKVWAQVNPDGSRHRCREHLPRFVLSVPYDEKESAKLRGARWDPVDQTWWAPVTEHALSLFEQWKPRLVEPTRVDAAIVVAVPRAANEDNHPE